MTCSDAREYLFAFLDNELDATLSIELQRHLERCHDCAREAEIEGLVHRRLAVALERPQPLLAHGFRQRRGAFWTVAAGIGIAACAALWFGRSAPTTNPEPLPFVDSLVADFEHVLQENIPLQFASSDSSVVADWLRASTGLHVTLPPIDSAHGKLLGARTCKVRGRTAAFAMYELAGSPASLVVLRDPSVKLDEMERVEHQGKLHRVDRCKNHTVVACRRGGLVYAAVSTLPKEALVHLMAGSDK